MGITTQDGPRVTPKGATRCKTHPYSAGGRAARAAMHAPAAPGAVAPATLREAAAKLLKESDAMTSVTDFRHHLAVRVGLHEDGLDDRADEVVELIRSAWRPAPPDAPPEDRMKGIVAEVGPEVADKRQYVYLITLSRALPETVQRSNLVDTSTLTRKAVGLAVRKAFDEPLARARGAPGRPSSSRDCESVVNKVAVFRESHADGDVHFHVAVSLSHKMAWIPPKNALREREGMATHWSCSHSQWWSAVRYGAMPTLKKTEVDDAPWCWTSERGEIEDPETRKAWLFEEAQRPFQARCWKRRREELGQRGFGRGGREPVVGEGASGGRLLALAEIAWPPGRAARPVLSAPPQPTGSLAPRRCPAALARRPRKRWRPEPRKRSVASPSWTSRR